MNLKEFFDLSLEESRKLRKKKGEYFKEYIEKIIYDWVEEVNFNPLKSALNGEYDGEISKDGKVFILSDKGQELYRKDFQNKIVSCSKQSYRIKILMRYILSDIKQYIWDYKKGKIEKGSEEYKKIKFYQRIYGIGCSDNIVL